MPDPAKKIGPRQTKARVIRLGYGEKARGNSNERGYNSVWRRVSKAYLKQHPLCVTCDQNGHTTAAVCVDHKTPHRGNKELFWDRDNWQGLCAACHSRKTGKGR